MAWPIPAPRVFHPGALPIRNSEFADAVRATCKPRFPASRCTARRNVGLAISGGADSMALAYLCSQMRRDDSKFRVADNRVKDFRCWIVDHQLRPESATEAASVAQALRDMRLKADVLTLTYPGGVEKFKDLANIEEVVRRLRYRRLGFEAANKRAASLLVAHHQDDQYETVLMRLASGYTGASLAGIRPATDIPECEGIYGAFRSGHLDDQQQPAPKIQTRLDKDKASVKYLRSLLENGEDSCTPTANFGGNLGRDMSKSHPGVPDPIRGDDCDVEDEGVFVFRPLLEFSKERLLATCLENNVPWWEDSTNKDPTYAMRNSIRYLWQGHNLPVALQKPAVLRLAKTWQRRTQAQEAEASRLLSRAKIHDFHAEAGTVSLQLPHIRLPHGRREQRSSLRRDARRRQKNHIAGTLVKKLVSLVDNDALQPSRYRLQKSLIPRLFPGVAEERQAASTVFNNSGVLFTPSTPGPSNPVGEIGDASDLNPTIWTLEREPYAATRGAPTLVHSYRSTQRKWSSWTTWRLWDGRFWIRTRHRLPYIIYVVPLAPQQLKAFEAALTRAGRQRLSRKLAAAANKARWTLPAICIRPTTPFNVANPNAAKVLEGPEGPSQNDNDRDNSSGSGSTYLHEKPWDSFAHLEKHAAKMQVLALPSLALSVDRANQWLEWDIRYKRVDRDVLRLPGTFQRRPFAPATRRAPRSGRRPIKCRRGVSRRGAVPAGRGNVAALKAVPSKSKDVFIQNNAKL